jgi:hypothetical protein
VLAPSEDKDDDTKDRIISKTQDMKPVEHLGTRKENI